MTSETVLTSVSPVRQFKPLNHFIQSRKSLQTVKLQIDIVTSNKNVQTE